MRQRRGAAWQTLAGVPRARRFGGATFVRRLFETTRAEILRRLQDRHIAWRDDPTNRDQRFLRNWVRLTWLPALQARHLQTRDLLSEAGRLAGGADTVFVGTASPGVGQGQPGGQTIQSPFVAPPGLPQV